MITTPQSHTHVVDNVYIVTDDVGLKEAIRNSLGIVEDDMFAIGDYPTTWPCLVSVRGTLHVTGSLTVMCNPIAISLLKSLLAAM